MNKNQKYKRILIVRLDRVGDVILSTPAIKAVRDAYPDSHIAIMVRPYTRDIVKGNPYVDEVITYDKEAAEKGLFGNLKFIWKIRKKRFDLAIILHPTKRSHIVTALAGIPERIGYDKKMGCMLTKKIPHTKQYGLKHEIDYTLDILRYIGIEPKARTLYVPLDPGSERKVEDIFARNGIKAADGVVVINPGASCVSRRWHPERFAAVGDHLAERFGMKIVVVSGGADKVLGDKAASLMEKGCVNLSGATTIGDIACLLKRARLLISTDTGPVHIACAVGTPVVAIFGRSNRGLSPARWGPSGKKDIVLHKDVGCDVCLAHNCRNGFMCLEAITVEEVLAAAERILG